MKQLSLSPSIPSRILLKISGEFLGGFCPNTTQSDSHPRSHHSSLSFERCHHMALYIKNLMDQGTEVALVVGGGNFVRGRDPQLKSFPETDKDYMGMLSTVMNGVALRATLEQLNVTTVLMTARTIEGIGSVFCEEYGRQCLTEKKALICTGGTGLPYFTTDTASVIRARQLGCHTLLKGTSVQGVFDKDPKTYSQATFLPRLTYDQCINEKIKIMDQTAFVLAKESRMSIIIFDLYNCSSITDIFHKNFPHSIIKDSLEK